MGIGPTLTPFTVHCIQYLVHPVSVRFYMMSWVYIKFV